MSKETAYQEMIGKFEKEGKREWSFAEIADVMERHQGIPKQETHKVLNQLAEEQKNNNPRPSRRQPKNVLGSSDKMGGEQKKEKEICLNCKHTRRFHWDPSCCSQPTCQCTGFIESRVYYGQSLFDVKEQTEKIIINILNEELEHWKTGCSKEVEEGIKLFAKKVKLRIRKNE